MAIYRWRPPCPECGSIRVRVVATGATEDDQPIRLRGCEECRHRFTTIEVPSPVSFYRLDAHRKWRNRMNQRAKRGYHGGMGGNPGQPTPRLHISIKVEERGVNVRRRREVAA